MSSREYDWSKLFDLCDVTEVGNGYEISFAQNALKRKPIYIEEVKRDTKNDPFYFYNREFNINSNQEFYYLEQLGNRSLETLYNYCRNRVYEQKLATEEEAKQRLREKGVIS